jgi:BirA family transcriptional regulator, biotin operon repressor / biotin---[acetyl-CoA-carboxylase] ligase
MIIGSNIIFIGNLPSTNTYAGQLIRTGNIQEGTIIHTNYQSAGRGQVGNSWESEDGKNLLMSIILNPATINPADQFIISMAVSLGICDFLNRYTDGCSIKWPNDIYVKNDKIAGILIENTIIGDKLEYCVAGIGLNLNQQKFMSNAPNPVSLKLITGSEYDPEKCLSQLSADLDLRYKQVISEEFAQIKMDYTLKLFRLNNWFNFRDQEAVFVGKIVSVADNGRLKVERKSGSVKEYYFKEIEYIL